MSNNEYKVSNAIMKKRMILTGFVIAFILSFLVIRLYNIMIINNDYSKQKLLNQIYKPIEYPGGFEFKGDIYDSNLKKLTNDGIQYKVLILPDIVFRYIKNVDMKYTNLFNIICDYNNIDFSTFRDKIEKEFYGSQKVLILQANDRVKSEVQESNLPGIYIKKETRKYGDNVGLSVISNFINNTMFNGDIKYNDSTDMKIFNYITRHKGNIYNLPLDGRGTELPGIVPFADIGTDYQASSTRDVVLTMDYEIQKAAEESLYELSTSDSSISVIDIKTGSVLAMASKDKNGFERNMVTYSGSNFAYNPGSIFKIIVLAAALEDNKIDTNTRFLCNGINEPTGIKCYKEDGHGMLNYEEAFTVSCNVYFIELARLIGAEKIISMAEKFGFGKKVLNFSKESTGMLYKNKNDIKYDIGNIAIGQKDIMVTPIQICNMISTIANDGVMADPYILKYVLNKDGSIFENTNITNHRVVSTKTAGIIKALMKSVVEKGTGKNAQISLGAAGKTGTPQRGSKTASGQYTYEDGWFAGYFPALSPKYAISVYIEDVSKQVSGGNTAALVFKNIAEKIIELKNTNNLNILN